MALRSIGDTAFYGILPQREYWIAFCRWNDYKQVVCLSDLDFLDSLKEFLRDDHAIICDLCLRKLLSPLKHQLLGYAAGLGTNNNRRQAKDLDAFTGQCSPQNRSALQSEN